MNIRPEIKRYSYRLSATMTLYVGVLIAVNLWFRTAPPIGPLAYVAAALPALPIAGVFVIMGRLFVEMQDEYVRAQFVRHSLMATGLTLSIITGWGFLERFGLAPHVAGYYASTIWFALLGLITGVNSLLTWHASRAVQ